MELPGSAAPAPNAWQVIDASRRLHRRLESRFDDALEELAKLDRAGLVDLLAPDGGVRVPIVTPTGHRCIQLGVDAIAPVRQQLLSISPDRRARFVEVADDVDAALRPPRRSWWFD